MDQEKLISTLAGEIEKLEQHQGFIAKTKEAQGKFSPAVIERVLAEHQSKLDATVAAVAPLIAEAQELISSLKEKRSEISEGAADTNLKLEELELRQLIGEIDDDTFASESASLKGDIGGVNDEVAAIDESITKLNDLLARCPDVDSESVADSSDGSQPESEVGLDDSDLLDEVEAGSEAESEPELELIEEDDLALDEAADSEEEAEVELELVDDEEDGDDLELELEPEGEVDDSPVQVTDERTAVLLYQEGTADEQIYPIEDNLMTLGRGRDNQVQVKNDSKVSRYHCKIIKRDSKFFIEDNESANGTLVNGELVNDRRLFGGEELIIGETFFRFRVLD